MLSRKLLFSLGILAVLAGVLLVILWFHTPGATPASAPAQALTRSILVAAQPIPAGTLLRKEDMTWSEVPADQVVGSDISNSSGADTELVGTVTRRAFAAREALTAIDLVRPGDRDFLVAALRPGYRAISIAVDASQSTSGLVSPGDHVDVLLTQSFSGQGTDAGHKSAGETVLRDLRVIAVDQTLVAAAKSEPSANVVGDLKMPKTITLEVTERQAAALLVAEQLGKIDLALRGQQDRDPATTAAYDRVSPIWASDVSRALAGPDPAKSDGSNGAIAVLHGAKIERLCPSSAGLLACP
jgi:pilus assembly protein CpaB